MAFTTHPRRPLLFDAPFAVFARSLAPERSASPFLSTTSALFAQNTRVSLGAICEFRLFPSWRRHNPFEITCFQIVNKTKDLKSFRIIGFRKIPGVGGILLTSYPMGIAGPACPGPVGERPKGVQACPPWRGSPPPIWRFSPSRVSLPFVSRPSDAPVVPGSTPGGAQTGRDVRGAS